MSEENKINRLKKENKSDFLEDQLVILTKPILNKFLKENNSSDLIALYTFYYYTAKWQKTNQPYCTDSYCQKALHWGYDKFIKAKKRLLDFKLIEQKINRKEDGTVEGYYIQVKYILKKENEPVPPKPSTGKQSRNALSTNIGNALSTNIILSKDNKSDKSEVKKSLKEKIKSSEKKEYFPEIYKLIDLFLKYNKNAIEKSNYSENNLKYTEIYYKKYRKEFSSDEDFLKSWVNSLEIFNQKDIKNMPKTSSNWFNFPGNKNTSGIESNYLYHRNDDFTLKRKKDHYPKITNKYAELYKMDLEKADNKDYNDFISAVNTVIRNYNEIVNRKIKYKDKIYTRLEVEDGNFSTFMRSIGMFVKTLHLPFLQTQKDNSNLHIGWMYLPKCWNIFTGEVKKQYDIDFNISNQELKQKCLFKK